LQEDYFSGSRDFGTGGHIFGTEICAASPSEDLTAQNHTTLRPQDTAGRDSHHYRVIQSLELTVGKDSKFIGAFDAFRKKRNVSSYDIGGGISHREVDRDDRDCAESEA